MGVSEATAKTVSVSSNSLAADIFISLSFCLFWNFTKINTDEHNTRIHVQIIGWRIHAASLAQCMSPVWGGSSLSCFISDPPAE